MPFKSIITAGASELGITLPPGAPEKMAEYFRMFDAKSKEMNLTAIKGEEEAARLHFLDSIAIMRYTDFAGKNVVDVGTGGGFPGVPVMIAAPNANVTLMDSTEKKIVFLHDACTALGLGGQCVHVRAEEAGQGELRESYDIAVSRAVARLNILCELCLPLVKPGGVFLAMKASDSNDEIAEAEKAITLLGGKQVEIQEYTIPCTDIKRRAVIIRKEQKTPAKYPRRYPQIKKAPL